MYKKDDKPHATCPWICLDCWAPRWSYERQRERERWRSEMTSSPDIHSTLLDVVLVYLYPGEALWSLDFQRKCLNVTQGQVRLEVHSCTKMWGDFFYVFVLCLRDSGCVFLKFWHIIICMKFVKTFFGSPLEMHPNCSHFWGLCRTEKGIRIPTTFSTTRPAGNIDISAQKTKRPY